MKAAKSAPAKNLSPLLRARAALKTILKEDPVTPLSEKTLRASMAHIPTGSVVMDYLIGGRPNQYGVAPCPGIPRGKIINLYGTAGAGKTTLSLQTAASVCKAGGCCVYIDWEHEVEPRYASALGVPVTDESKFMLIQPDTMEEGMKTMVQMASEGVDLIVLDSVGAAVPEVIFNRDVTEEGNVQRIGLVAGMWSQFLPKFKTLVSKSNTAVIGVSQLRKAINTGPHGPDSTIQGGEAWKFYSAVRIMLRVFQKEKAKQFSALTGKTEDTIVGTVVMAKLDKNKVSDSAHHEAKFFLRSGYGIDNTRSIVDLAISYKILSKEGSWFEWTNPKGETIKAQGMDGIIKKIESQKDGLKTLFAQVAPKLLSSGPVFTETPDDGGLSDEGPPVDDNVEDLFDMVPTSDPKKAKAKKDKAAAASFEGDEPPAAFMSEIGNDDA